MKINKFRAIMYIASWLPLFAINIVLIIVGIPIVGWYARKPMKDWPRWTWLWQNDEDEGDLGWYVKRFSELSPWMRRFRYMAFRNPVNNHRFLFTEPESFNSSGDPLAFDMEGFDLVQRGIQSSSGWRWSGKFGGYKRTWLNGPDKYSEFYIGWKVGSAVPGLGFTFQLRLKRDFINS